MAKTLSANQTQKIDRPQIQPIYLVHVSTYGGDTLYFSDRNYIYNGKTYEAYLFDLPQVGSIIANLGGYDNLQFTLKFNNSAFRGHDYLIQFFDDYPIEGQYVEIYKLLIDTGETFSSDVSTKIFKGMMGQPYAITEIGFSVDCSCMLFAKDKSLPLDTLDLADFPSADPDDVGKYRNIIYGSVKKAVCLWTVAGWASTLVSDITATATSVEVSDSALSPPAPFTMMCESEEIRVTDKSGNTFTVTRGYNSTTNVKHNRGTPIYEKRSDFEAEVAMHAVKSIDDVYVKREGQWVRVISGITKYEDDDGRAIIIFSDKVKFEQTINISAEVDTDVDTGSHGHSLTASIINKQCIPTGYVQSGADNPGNAIDGNTASYAGIDESDTVGATFTETDLGTISKEIIHIYKNSENATGYVQCPSGTNLTTLGAGIGWFRVVKTSGMAWGDSVVVVGGSGGNQIGEIYKEIEYQPASTTQTSAATGVDVEVDVTLSGNSAANLLIGEAVACNVDGYKDNGSGTYTGTPNALIERPDHVRKHVLAVLLGISLSDIDSTTFSTVGTIYGDRVYEFAFVLPEIATEAMELFRQFDLQTRSHMFESGGTFKLSFCSPDEPTSQFVFNANNVKGEFVFSKTEIADIRNKIRAHFYRDYTKIGDLGFEYRQVAEQSDSSSISKYGLMAEDIEFNLVGDNSDMVYDVVSWILSEKRETKRLVKFSAFWDASILEQCDYFTVTSNFWDGYKYKLLSLQEYPETQEIEMSGIEFAASDIDGHGLIYRGMTTSDDVQAIHRVGSQSYAGLGTYGAYRYLGNGNWSLVDEAKKIRCFLEFNDYLYCGTYGAFAGMGIVYKLVSGSWSSIGSPGNCKAVYCMAEFDSKIYVGVWSDGKIFRLDAGPSWADVGQPGAETSILSLAVVGSTLYCGGYSGTVYRYDGGTTWTSIGYGGYRLATNDGKLYGTIYSAPSYLMNEYVSGTTWNAIGNISGGAYTRPEICAFDNKIYWGVSIWLDSKCGYLYEYSGSGETWNLMATISNGELSSLFPTTTAIWIGTDDGRIFSWS